jgi:hypothetical protein
VLLVEEKCQNGTDEPEKKHCILSIRVGLDNGSQKERKEKKETLLSCILLDCTSNLLLYSLWWHSKSLNQIKLKVPLYCKIDV